MSLLFATAGSRLDIGIAKAANGADFVAADFTTGSPTWTEIGGTTNLNAALATINNVRRTHGGTILPALTYSDQDDLRTKLRQERRREFAFECMRWFDLKRWNILIPTIKASLADYYNKPLSDYDFIDNPDPNRYKVLPIPIQEIANNPNVTQNPGF